MKQFLLFILLLFLSPFVVGQGAATPELAWDSDGNPGNGIQKDFWFQLEQDFPQGETDWVFKAASTAYFVNLNEEISSGIIPAGNQTQQYYDPQLNSSNSTCSATSFEEWFIIVVPSNQIINITFDLTSNSSTFNRSFKTLGYYLFNEESDLTSIIDCSSPTNGDPSKAIYGSSGIISDITGLATLHLTSNEILGRKYIAIRIGNNFVLPVFGNYSTYSLTVWSKNEICENALKAPVSLIGFNSSTDRNLLNSSSELSDAYYSSRAGNVSTGNNDLKLPATGNTGTNGMWFHVEGIVDDPVYAALCNVSQNAQMVIYKDNSACPVLDASDASDIIVGAEDQNADLNGNLGVDVCLSDPNNPNNPVMRIDAPASSYYIYLFGDDGDGGLGFDFDFYFLNYFGTELGGGGILPVTWLDFDGKALGKQNKLVWQTASEQQNDYFILEKSKDGENYMELARVEGAGNSTFEKNYSFIDSSPYVLTYYRISQVDWDGTIHSGPQTVVENNATINNFQVLINPVETNSIQLSYYITKEENIRIDIYTINGVKVYSENRLLMKENNNFAIPINDMENGVYIISIKTNFSNYTQKIIINTLH